jgi:hypothetical protein
MNTDFTTVTKKPLTRKQKILWGVGIAAVLLYFNPSLLRPVFGLFSRPVVRKPSPIVPVVPPTPEQLAASELARESAIFGGKWVGRGLVVGRGTCNASLEIKTQPDPAKPFAGYSNMLCVDMTIHAGMSPETAAILTAEKLAPESTVLSGNVTKGTIGYTTDRVVSQGQSKCDMQSMDVTPFGSNQIAIQWKDSCGGGQMQLARGNF